MTLSKCFSPSKNPAILGCIAASGLLRQAAPLAFTEHKRSTLSNVNVLGTGMNLFITEASAPENLQSCSFLIFSIFSTVWTVHLIVYQKLQSCSCFCSVVSFSLVLFFYKLKPECCYYQINTTTQYSGPIICNLNMTS